MTTELLTNIKIDKRYLVPTLAAIYALISVQNVAHFFEGLNHGSAMSWTAGLAIGATLVILAHYLSETPMSDRNAFYGLLGVTLVFVALTTIIQGSNYAPTLGAWGYLFALVLAGAGELALPLAYAVAENAKRRREVTEAGQKAEQIAAETVLQVMKGLDVAKAQKQAEKRIERLIVAHVDATVTKLMPRGINDTVDNLPVKLDANLEPTDTPNLNKSPVLENVLDAGRVKANDQKRQTATQRRIKVLATLDKSSSKADLNFAQIGRELGKVSGQTIANDLQWLEGQGFWLNGSDWKMTDRGRAWMDS